MLANSLQEQDPMHLKINEDCEILSPEILSRHQHYVDSNCLDEEWINLTVILNKDNPLTQNEFAPLNSQTELNSPVSCENIVDQTMAGLHQKKYVIFSMESEELEKSIKQYYENKFYPDGNVKKEEIQEIQKKLLK